MARPHPALVELAKGRPIGAVADSDELMRSAIEHRMGGLLWAAIRDDQGVLDEDTRTQLGTQSLTTRLHAKALWTTLLTCTDALAQLGIDVATFKGVTAEARWYDRLGDRPCGDVDLLLAPRDHHRVGEVVAALQPAHPLANDVDALVAAGELQSVELRVDGIELDLHLDLFKLGIPSRQREAIWDRTLLLTTPHGPFRVLDNETALIQLLLHLNKDRFRWLLGYVDVAHLVQRESVDWTAVRAIAIADGLEDVVALSLQCVLELLDLEPGHSLAARGWRKTAWCRLWSPSVRLQGDLALSSYHLRQAALPVLMRGRQVDAMRYLARRLAPEPRLVRYHNPTAEGGYLRRLASGRLARRRIRRRDATSLRTRARSRATTDALEPERAASVLRLAIASKPFWVETSGDSMGRAIPSMSEVLIVPGTQPRRGEVWAFCDDTAAIVVHRCRGRKHGDYVFEGDTTGHADRPVSADRLVGRVTAVRRAADVHHLGRVDSAVGAAATLGRRAIRRARRALRS